ncbi:hypothetical protein V9T40_002538 [Parthenolecanium corni]|uniref:Uncharacterized protein n=1 Tax=Parthenolecanium corni TaxID=536013 RepID=A0AAN9Y5G3_9HEMI
MLLVENTCITVFSVKKSRVEISAEFKFIDSISNVLDIRMSQEISYKTDPKNTDYLTEAGAMRNIMTIKVGSRTGRTRGRKIETTHQASNSKRLLENITQQSKIEMKRIKTLGALEELSYMDIFV